MGSEGTRLTAWINVVAGAIGLAGFVVSYVKGHPTWWLLATGALWALVGCANFRLAGRQRREERTAGDT